MTSSAMNRRTSRFSLHCLAAVLVGTLPSTCQAAPPQLLPPTGPLSIGRTSSHWVKPARNPTATDSFDKRELMAHVWYPANPRPAAPPAAYMPQFRAIEAALGAENLKHEIGASYEALGNGETHAVEDAELSSRSEKYPVLLIFHGLRFNVLGYSMLAEDLASHGYIVVGIDFPPIAFAVNFPDGRTTRFPESTWSRPRSPTKPANSNARSWTSAHTMPFSRSINYRDSSPANCPALLKGGSIWRTGVLGHSFGARIAARTCQLDRRLKAAALLDGFGRTMTVEKRPDGSTLELPVMVQYVRRVPRRGILRFLALLQTPGRDLEEELRRGAQEFCQSVKADSYELTFETPGIVHESFSDILLLESGQSDETRQNRTRAMQLIREYTRAFFDRYVRGLPAPLFDQVPAAAPDVELIRHPFDKG